MKVRQKQDRSEAGNIAQRAERGNVAVLFALVSSVSLGVLGATIELNRISAAKASLAAAADAGALAAKRTQSDRSLEGVTASRLAGAEAGTRPCGQSI